MNRRIRVRDAVVLAGLAVLLGVTGCAIQPDAQPRDISEEDRGAFGEDVATGDEAAGTSLIFLLAPNEPGEIQLLRSAMRDVPVPVDVTPVLRSLLSGPNADEREAGIDTDIPVDLVLNTESVLGRVSMIDVNEALDELDAVSLRYAIAQIVFTVTSVEGIDAVQIKVNGEDRLWPRGDGELTATALTPYDYPGLVESTQPPYPAVPSGM
jgi:spore germination protein GerM